MKEFHKRLIAEKVDLEDRAEKLHNFLDSDGFTLLDKKTQDLLSKQFMIMVLYHDVLNERLELLKTEK